ncbi:hypothetical protein ASD40_07905 [Paenibacillus sp. Root444D2]|nr:hypothetical protein ASD40_07905 [Paenibacillus sp. Root444D2]
MFDVFQASVCVILLEIDAALVISLKKLELMEIIWMSLFIDTDRSRISVHILRLPRRAGSMERFFSHIKMKALYP